MKFDDLIEIIGDEPVFETGLLLVGETDPGDVRRQLSRWTKAGRLYQLRRGLYTLAPPFQKVKAHPFLIANRLVRGSYISCQSALAYYNLIPEYVPITTSVAAGRPARWETPLGVFEFRNLKTSLIWGYRLIDVDRNQKAFVAAREKALLDLVHLHPGGDAPEYLDELRLQNLEQLNSEDLERYAQQTNSPKLERAANHIARLAESEMREYESS